MKTIRNIILIGIVLFSVVYELEVPYIPSAGQPEQIRIVKLKGFSNERITAAEINAVLASFEADINAGYNYIENLHAAMLEAFRIKLGIDNKFGLTANDWENPNQE